MGGVCLGGLLVGLGLKLVSGCEAMGRLLAAGQPDYSVGCAWHFGWAGWAELCLGGSLLGPEAGKRVTGWAGPEASRRHVRHASRRPKGLGLLDDLGRDKPGLSCLGSRNGGWGTSDRLGSWRSLRPVSDT